mmetsp:Transcript_20099/g.24367  ORF Transcript_20099/g.24367 Transcript_20099/m.24367 type:complete len:115 (-) Transcript_20099:97-441(-)
MTRNVSLSCQQLEEILRLKDARIKDLEAKTGMVEELQESVRVLTADLRQKTEELENMKALVKVNKKKFDQDVSKLNKTLEEFSKNSSEMKLRDAQEQYLAKKTGRKPLRTKSFN